MHAPTHTPPHHPNQHSRSRRRQTLISVSDKTGIMAFATALQKNSASNWSPPAAPPKLFVRRACRLRIFPELTGFPEMMDGRVKTLHPAVHGGFLALRDNPAHLAAMQKHNIQPIDLICVNLYPFEATIAKPDCSFEEAIENIDIGGPAMIRSAAKNHRSIVVVTDAVQYEKVLKHLRCNKAKLPINSASIWPCGPTRARHNMTRRFIRIWPRSISKTIWKKPSPNRPACSPCSPRAQKDRGSALRRKPASGRRLLFNSEFSMQHAEFDCHRRAASRQGALYINLLDADAAIELVREFSQPAAAVIKHTNPCGCATGETLKQAFELAYAGDPVAAFGGIVALNREVDVETAEAIVAGKRFLEVLIAPAYAPAALEILKDRWKDCRILATGPLSDAGVPTGTPLPSSISAPSPAACSFNSPTWPALTAKNAPSPPSAAPPMPNGRTWPSSGWLPSM